MAPSEQGVATKAFDVSMVVKFLHLACKNHTNQIAGLHYKAYCSHISKAANASSCLFMCSATQVLRTTPSTPAQFLRDPGERKMESCQVCSEIQKT